MTRKTNARLAGFMFLFYIATASTEMAPFGRASRGEGASDSMSGIVGWLLIKGAREDAA